MDWEERWTYYEGRRKIIVCPMKEETAMKEKKVKMAVGAFGDMMSVTRLENPEVRRFSPDRSEKVKEAPFAKAVKRQNRARESSK